MSRRANADNRAGERPAAEWMARAVDAARTTHPHPNPRVGAIVLTADGLLASEAVHESPGEPHAEAAALERAGAAAAGGTLVVTLEPCDHHGRTGPCTEVILAAGIARVVVGAVDPDPHVAGAGIRRLREAGLTVDVGVLAGAVETMDPGYFHHRRTGRPRVTLKLAATLDGQTAAADGTSQWITGEAARADAHQLRAESDAVMVGAGTLRVDDPRLDVRLDGFTGPQPRPIVVAGHHPLPETAAVFTRRPLVYSPQRRGDLGDGVELEVLWHPTGVDLAAMMKDLGGRGVVDLLVEGGPTLAASLLGADLVDVFVLYFGGGIAGGVGRPLFEGEFTTLSDLTGFDVVSARLVGTDVRIDARPSRGVE